MALDLFAGLGSAVSAIGNWFGGRETREAQQANNLLQLQEAKKNREMQTRFAKEGIRWRVEDAKAAGIHPLYALGAQTHSYSPVTAGTTAETGLASGMAAAGQDIGRAVNATRSGAERVDAYTEALQALSLERGKLQNEVLRTQLSSNLARLRQQTNPAGPEITRENVFEVPQAKKADDQNPLMWFGRRIRSPIGTSPGKAFDDVLGDDVMSPGFFMSAPAVLAANPELLIEAGKLAVQHMHPAQWWRRIPRGSR